MNIFIGSGWQYHFLTKKFCRVMRITFFLLTVILIKISAVETHAQSSRVTLNANNFSIKEVLKEIEKQSDYTFFYNDLAIDMEHKVRVNVKNEEIRNILANILPHCSLEIDGKRIIIIPRLPSVLQDSKRITGTVTDERGEPVIGANIMEKGTTNGVITDIDGEFSLSIKQNAILQISYIGYLTQEITVANQSHIKCILYEDSQSLEEVVVVGYGTKKRRDVIGSVATVKTEDIMKSISGNIMNSLQGKASGLNIISNDQGTKAQIRGIHSINSSSDPLWIVDGFPTSNAVNPADIESVEILKDASATAIYGSRGSNGVIIITTKKGSKNSTNLNIDIHAGVSPIVKDQYDFGYADNKQFYRIMDMATTNSNTLPFNPQNLINEESRWYARTLSREESEAVNENYFKELYRTGSYQDINVSLNTGNDKGATFMSANFRHSESNAKNNSDLNFQFRANTDYEIAQNLLVGSRLFGLINKGDNPNNTSHRISTWLPFYADDDPYGTRYWNTFSNPVAKIDEKFRLSNYENVRLLGGLYAEWKIPFVEGLSIRSEANINYSVQTSTSYEHELITGVSGSDAGNKANEKAQNGTQYSYNIYMKYNRAFGKHNVSATFGTESEGYKGYYRYGEGKYIPGTYQQLGSNPGQIVAAQGYLNGEEYLRSFFGRADYKFNDRYLAGISLRRDGVSNFEPDCRWGTFTAFSLGWIINEEDFLKDVSWVNLLKLRGSFGQTGNKAVPNKTKTTFDNSNDWQYGEYEYTQTGGTRPTNIGNPLLTWETTSSYDLGIDFSFLDNRLNGSFAYYLQDVDGLVLAAAMPPSTGLGWSQEMWGNMGRIINKGIEFNLSSVNYSSSNFTWTTDFNLTTNTNKVKKLTPDLDDAGVPLYHDTGFGKVKLMSITGGGIKEWYLCEFAGIDSEKGVEMIWEIDYDKWLETGETIKTGRMIPATQNNLSRNQIRQKNKTVTPKFFGGLSNSIQYKNWDMNFLFTFSGGNYIYDHEFISSTSILRGSKPLLSEMIDKSWKKPGDNAKYPELRWNGSHPWDWDTEVANPNSPTGKGDWVEREGNYNDDGGKDTRAFFKGDYLKLKHLEIGYTFSKELLNKTRISHLRLYLAAENLFTITNYPGWDPEYALVREGNPNRYWGNCSNVVTTTISAGLQLKF